MRLRAVSALLVFLALAQGAGATPGAQRAFDVGDSLSAGTALFLPVQLRGWSIQTHHDVGLHLEQGVRLIQSLGASLPPVVIVSLGTNDDPRFVTGFGRGLERILAAAGPERCVVWTTIARPPAVGASYAGYNRALRRVASQRRNLVVVDWAAMVRAHPQWLRGDGVHVTATGYRARAVAIATAVMTGCR